MKILLTGGTGFIGRHLIQKLSDEGHELICLTRSKERAASILGQHVAFVTELSELGQASLDAVINLAGEPIVDQRWSDARKTLLEESRINMTANLISWLEGQEQKPEVLVSGSAIGFYGSYPGDEPLDEASGFKEGFTHDLCDRWESEARKAESLGIRVCLIRTGIVLGEGGALNKMLLPFKLGLGGQVGSGHQWMSWIHIDDEVDAIVMLLTDPRLTGVFNLTAPQPVINREFAKALGKQLNRPTILPLPAFMAKLMLGEGAELLLEGQRVFPERLLEAGYKFNYLELDEALKAIL